MERLARSLFASAEEMQPFLGALTERHVAQTAVAWLRHDSVERPYRCASRPPWIPPWIDVAAEGERPGKLAAHAGGDLYCLDLSSTFACAAFSEIDIPSPVIVDVCAAPGGKGIVGSRYLPPALTIANEVIRKRTAQLISNYQRCKMSPAVVVSYDPKILAEKCARVAHVVIVDAPCSGQSLLVKDKAAPGAFHPATISMNERRQRRIMAQSQSIVREGGYLLYSTCTFSREENEDVVEWFLSTFDDFEPVDVALLQGFRSHLTTLPCYRLWPQQRLGAGAFVALFRRRGELSDEITHDEVLAGLWSLWRSPDITTELGQSRGLDSSKDRRQAKSGQGKRRSKERRWRFQPGST